MTVFKPDSGTRNLPSIAKLDRAIVLTRGLFRCLPKNPPTRPLIALEELFLEDKVSARCAGPQLSVKDLMVLQAVVAIATRQVELAGRVLKRDEEDDGAPVMARLSMAHLGAVVGYESAGSGAVNTVITDSLVRLCSMRLSWAPPDALAVPVEPLLADVDGKLLQPRQRGRNGAELHLQLHRRLAFAVRGGVEGQSSYLKLHVVEAQRLASDAARLLHHRLSQMREGEETEYRLDTLVEYVAGAKAKDRTRSMLRHDEAKTRAALDQVRTVLKWRFKNMKASPVDAMEKLKIKRPPTPATTS